MKKQLIGLAVTVALVGGTAPMAFAGPTSPPGPSSGNSSNTNTNSNSNRNGNTNSTSNETSNTGSSSSSASAYSNGSSTSTDTNTKTVSDNGNGSNNTSGSDNTTTTTTSSHSRSVNFNAPINLEKSVSTADLRATTSDNKVSYMNHSKSTQENNFNRAFASVAGITNASQNSGNMSNVQQSVNVSISGGSSIK